MEETTLSIVPLVPVAMIDPTEFNMADRMLFMVGCVTLGVVKPENSSCRGKLLLTDKASEKLTLNTALPEASVIIVGTFNCPWAAERKDQPVPTRVITSAEAPNDFGRFIIFGVKEILMEVVDFIALLASCNTGSPVSRDNEGIIATNEPLSPL